MQAERVVTVPAVKNARTRIFKTPWNDCRTCGATGRIERVERVRMRHDRGVLRHLQAVQIEPCKRCKGRGRRFVGLPGALVELAYAAFRPYSVAVRAALTKPPVRGVIRSMYEAEDRERPQWRRRLAAVRFGWRKARAESKQQIALISAEFHEGG